MLEFIILISSMISAYCLGNVIGYASGRKRQRVADEADAYTDAVYQANQVGAAIRDQANRRRQEIVDDLSRQSLAWSEEDNAYTKVYDAEVIDFPSDYNDRHSKR